MPKSLASKASPPKRRGRPRSFDREAALHAAMMLFWTRGFEGASLAELTNAMGINPPSLYAAFGDKEGLFLEAMERYQARWRSSCPWPEEPTAERAVRRLLTECATAYTQSGAPRGCLIMMGVDTSASSAARVQKALAAGIEQAAHPPAIPWSVALAGALAYVALGPALVAYWAWGAGVARVGPTVAALFSNLTPLFTALLSLLALGQAPEWYHGVAFVLIAAGIAVSARR